MTDRAVVVPGSALVLRRTNGRSSVRGLCAVAPNDAGDHVLMFIVRKYRVELARLIRLPKSEATFAARRDFCMTDRADRRTGAFEEFGSVTLNTG